MSTEGGAPRGWQGATSKRTQRYVSEEERSQPCGALAECQVMPGAEHYNAPFVEGTPATRASSVTADAIARATALNAASMM